jgi:6-phosphofructokinase
MNERIDELTKEIWNEDVKVFNSTEGLRKLLINLKIITANLPNENKAEIKAFGGFLEDNITKLQESTKKIKELTKEIAKINGEEI